MKRRWFLAGLALSAVGAGCQTNDSRVAQTEDGGGLQVTRNSKTLVVATAANYPPYEHLMEGATDITEADPQNADGQMIVGFDIDLAQLIAQRLDRQLSVVDLEFGALIPSLVNDEVDMAIAALEPSRTRKQKVDFSNIYYRSRQALISIEGYLRPSDLNYQIIGIREGSVQARYTDRISAEYPDLDIVTFDSLEEVFEALDIGTIEGLITEANVADDYLRQYSDFEARMMPSDQPSGSAIALPKNSPLRRDINAALSAIKASGEMDELIKRWFS